MPTLNHLTMLLSSLRQWCQTLLILQFGTCNKSIYVYNLGVLPFVFYFEIEKFSLK
jgi:hypothetical protein